MPDLTTRLSRAFAIALAAVAVLIGVVLLAQPRANSSEADLPAASTAQRSSVLETNFSAFRRSREAPDALPQEILTWPGPVIAQLRAHESRLLYSEGRSHFYAVPQGDTGVCLVSWGGSPGLSCTTVESAAQAATPLFVTGEAGVYGLVPDSVAGGTITDAGGTRELARGENALVETSVERPEKAELTLRDGSKTSVVLAPAEPKDATDDTTSEP